MKALVRHNYPRHLNMWDDMDRVFNTIFDGQSTSRRVNPSVDVREEEDQYLLEAELPGFGESDVDVKIDDNLLTISSKMADDTVEEKAETDGKYLIRERRTASFSRSFVLPKNVDPEKIKGTFADGILTLTLEKRPETKPRAIEIKKSR